MFAYNFFVFHIACFLFHIACFLLLIICQSEKQFCPPAIGVFTWAYFYSKGMLSFERTSWLFEKKTLRRRKLLLKEKSFFCKERCCLKVSLLVTKLSPLKLNKKLPISKDSFLNKIKKRFPFTLKRMLLFARTS